MLTNSIKAIFFINSALFATVTKINRGYKNIKKRKIKIIQWFFGKHCVYLRNI